MLAERAAAGTRIAWLDAAVARLEKNDDLDDAAALVAAVAEPFNRPEAARVLRGDWLGHALHPLLTDVPLGCWIAALTLDTVGGRATEVASRRLIGFGLAWVPLTAAAGLSEWNTVTRDAERRVVTVHAAGNVLASLAFLLSWRHRRRHHRRRGRVWGLVGGALALATGYLGGHLSFARGVGMAHRGRRNR